MTTATVRESTPETLSAGLLLTKVGAGLATKLATEGGDWLAGWALNALGLSSDNGMMAALQQIESELTEIITMIQQLGVAVSQLETQLAIDTSKLEAYIQEAAIHDDIASIDAHYSTLQDMNSEVAKGGQPEMDPKQFAADVLTAWDIPTAVQSISNALQGNEGLSGGLLDTWTDFFILQMGPSPAAGSLLNYFQLLMQLFDQQVKNQLKGVVLTCAAKSASCDPNSPCVPATDYLTDFTSNQLQPQVTLFLQNVERLVLSQYDMTVNAASAPLPGDAAMVFACADVYAANTLNQPGLYGRVIGPPSMKPPSLQPAAAYAASAGTMTPATAYKCADSSQQGGANQTIVNHLFDGNKSAVQVVRYFWAWPSPAPVPGAPIDAHFEGGNVFPYYYDRGSLAVVSTPGDNTILFGSFTDASRVGTCLDLLAQGWDGWTSGWDDRNSGQAIGTKCQWSNPGLVQVQATVVETTIGNNLRFMGTNKFTLTREIELAYDGVADQVLHIVGAGSCTIQNVQVTADDIPERLRSPYNLPLVALVRLYVNLSGVASGSGMLFDYSVNPDSSGASFPIAVVAPVQVPVHAPPATITLGIECTIQTVCVEPTGRMATIAAKLDYLRLAWSRP